MSMRMEGVKIALLVPYADDMSRESAFCADHVAAGRLEQLPDMDRGQTWNRQETEDFLEGKRSQAPAFLPELLALPADTCICTQSPALPGQAAELLRRYNRPGKRIGTIAMEDFNGRDRAVTNIAFDRKAQLEAAFQHVADPRKSPTGVVQKLFPYTFVPGSSWPETQSAPPDKAPPSRAPAHTAVPSPLATASTSE